MSAPDFDYVWFSDTKRYEYLKNREARPKFATFHDLALHVDTVRATSWKRELIRLNREEGAPSGEAPVKRDAWPLYFLWSDAHHRWEVHSVIDDQRAEWVASLPAASQAPQSPSLPTPPPTRPSSAPKVKDYEKGRSDGAQGDTGEERNAYRVYNGMKERGRKRKYERVGENKRPKPNRSPPPPPPPPAGGMGFPS